MFGFELGFYGPGIYLVALKAGHGWSTEELSSAIACITFSAQVCSSWSSDPCSTDGVREPSSRSA
jgi:hypothetical protein